GDTIVAPAGALHDGTSMLQVGSRNSATDPLPFKGRINYADVRNGIDGTVVARFDPSKAASTGVTSFTSSSGELWTLAGGAALTSGTSAQDQVSTSTYTALNQLDTATAPDGTATQYTYDAVGNLVKTVKAAGTGEARSLLARYDAQGRLVAELSGNGVMQ